MNTSTVPGRLAYSVKEAAAIVGVSHHTIYREINAGNLVPKRLGSRTLIDADDLRSFVKNLEAAMPRRGPNSKR